MTERIDLAPLLVGIRLGHPRRFIDPCDRHLVPEDDLALVDRTADRRGALRIGRRGQRQVSLAGKQP
jgi:hypothetical protein